MTDKNEQYKQELQNVLDKMQAIYLKHIPNGHCFAKSRQIIGSPFGHFSVGMIEELDDCPHKIRDNDKSYGMYSLEIINSEFILEKVYHRISEIPRQQYNAMHLEPVKFRKMKDKDLNKFLAKFEKHIVAFKAQLKDAIENNRLYEQKSVKEIYLKLD